ncbi:pyruvate carboxylase subunit B [Desulforegula conservatrix]|uniref:pyruvate carboxylase subunit B n=1 Tax=Desulforegula conservatrix TaxID=153026 RepID=UPI000418D053|nr:pyruvate carboxylase subunit B [Desulforegula conservatrix]
MSSHSRLNTTDLNYSQARLAAENPLKIMDLSLRDGHQSLFSTRGRTEDMLRVAELMDEVGFWAVETWGGATFDSMHRFLNEDPWDRLRTLKAHFKKTPMSMLLRGQNLVGYRNYADDLVEAFVEKTAENGMDIFRTFDALNDYRNFEAVVPVIKRCGKHFQGCICYTITEPRMGGDVYNIEYFLGKAKELESMGADSICIKDMAGLLAPYDAYDLISSLKQSVKVPILLHTHFTSGMAPMTHLKAIEAGVDIIDTCMTPYAYRTSHPAVEPLVMSLLGTNRDTGFDISKLGVINEILEKDVMPKYRQYLDDTKMSIIDINVLLHQTPGGMLSNLVNQLKEMGNIDKLEDVYKELPRVRKELGQPPLVTPSSQIIGTQTLNNVLFDTDEERYKMVTDQVKDLCYGLYGKTPVAIDTDVQKKALVSYSRGETPITCRPAEVLEPELEKARKEISDVSDRAEDVILYAMFPVTGRKFLKWKYGRENAPLNGFQSPSAADGVCREDGLKNGSAKKEDAPPKGIGSRAKKFKVAVEGDVYEVWVDDTSKKPVLRDIKLVRPDTSSHAQEHHTHAVWHESVERTPASESGIVISAPMPGMIVRYEKKEGDHVEKGDTIVVLEAMKMENAIATPVSGTVKSIGYNPGDSVQKNAVLAVIEQ